MKTYEPAPNWMRARWVARSRTVADRVAEISDTTPGWLSVIAYLRSLDTKESAGS